MRYIAIFTLFVLSSTTLTAQYILSDPALKAQEKRMVAGGRKAWSDWKPEPRYPKVPIIGTQIPINTSLEHAIVFGKTFSYVLPWVRRNRRYKDGANISPLYVTGLETQRQAELPILENQTKKTREHIKSLRELSKNDFIHWSSAMKGTDPLYLLYYKRMLSPLREMPEIPRNYKQWGMKSKAIYDMAAKFQQLEKLQEKLDLAKDTYAKALSINMPRGKRILMYHKTLMEWRELQKMVARVNFENDLMIGAKDVFDDVSNLDNMDDISNLDDNGIMQQAVKEYDNISKNN